MKIKEVGKKSRCASSLYMKHWILSSSVKQRVDLVSQLKRPIADAIFDDQRLRSNAKINGHSVFRLSVQNVN